MDVSSSGGASVNSRWSPTKEQISMLESFYSQGIRTPSTEMIEKIASRLKVYGHIEGKNVFYWFQNHKARQGKDRSRKKRSTWLISVTIFTGLINLCLQLLAEMRYDQQEVLHEYQSRITKNKFERNLVTIDKSSSDQETLPLFPLHPTGILGGATAINSRGSSSAENSINSTPVSSSETALGIGEHSADHKPFFDFFSEKEPFESCHRCDLINIEAYN